MMQDSAIYARNLGKCYQVYANPLDRLKQSLWRGKKKFYREFWAIQNASFEIRKGETVGIIGSNGSGKSTLLQLVCGILPPTSGELEVNGRIAALLELGAGFNPEFTGRENVFLNAAIMGISRAEINDRYDEIVRFADIGHFIDQPVKTYSSGMYVRLAFATAINVSPDILLIDEALAVGDARFRQKCMAKIRAFCREGTAIFVSHDTTAVTELCSRVIWVESGEIRMDGLPKFVVEKYLQYMYEGNPADKTASGASPEPTGDSDLDEFSVIDNKISQFGNLDITIEAVRIRSRGSINGVVYTGQPCEICMILHAHRNIANPIAGYLVKDRLGREIMGDNTELIRHNLPGLSEGQRYMVTFGIDEWPNISEEEYALCVAIADGSSAKHEQCHYLHDALIFKSIPIRAPAGIFSVPNTSVKFLSMS
ncbi:ABC transporter ATP-binding protein [Desulfococcaceae bacterium HSG8]|nr:ABC transporter ATP-binding protein [Desulfococcaceae bacterium HSG8]